MKKHLRLLTPVALYAGASGDRQDVDLSVSARLRALRNCAKGQTVAPSPGKCVDEAESGRVAGGPRFRETIEEYIRTIPNFQLIPAS